MDVSELYALPDHEVIEDLLPWIDPQVIALGRARQYISESPGIIPIAVDPQGDGALYWADIGDYPYREWQHIFTIKTLAETGKIKNAFKSPMDILLDDDLFTDGIEPSGLIFHVSRCGSTLLGKSIARLDENIVVNQGAPLQRGFWAYLTRDWSDGLTTDERSLRMFRNLALAMTRKRASEQSTAFVKFISWNTLYVDFIRRTFPDVPAVFLYRDPVEVIASVKKATTAALVAKTTRQAGFLVGDSFEKAQGMSDVEYLAHCYANYFKAVLKSDHDGLSIIEYPHVTPGNLSIILGQGLNYPIDINRLSRMKEQFKVHSKDDQGKSVFKDDREQKQLSISSDEAQIINETCSRYIDRLRSAPCNLFKHVAKVA